MSGKGEITYITVPCEHFPSDSLTLYSRDDELFLFEISMGVNVKSILLSKENAMKISKLINGDTQ